MAPPIETITEFETTTDPGGFLPPTNPSRFLNDDFSGESASSVGPLPFEIPALTILDTEVLTEIQYHMLEQPDNGQTFRTGKWTVQEVVDYLNQRQRQFLKDTVILASFRTSVKLIPGASRVSLPQNWILTRRVVWHSESPDARTFIPLSREDMFSLDYGQADHVYNRALNPSFYTESELPTLELEVSPPASQGGQLELLGMILSKLLSNTGVEFGIPIEWVHCIKYGAMADMLRKAGRGYDAARADWCEQRYQEGVEAAQLVQDGWA